MRFNFGSRELVNCLLCLGFTPIKQKSTKHQKFLPPPNKRITTPGQRSFYMVQHAQKEYDPHARTRYIKQIMNFKFTEEEIMKCFKR